MIALLASVLAHAVGIAALGGSYGTLLDLQSDPITAADEHQEIQLGIERSAAQTIDWIGYEEYQKHLAPPAEQSQALMELGASPASKPSPPAEQPTPQQQPVEQPATEAVEQAVEQAARTVEELLLDPLFALIDDPLFFVARDPEATEGEAEESQEQAQAAPSPPPPAPTAEQTETVEEKTGNANKDADAVSRETPEEFKEWSIGKPLSAQGLDIRTVKPEWSDLTLLTARPRNPKVTVRFNRSGRVASATINLSSGHRDVDRPLLDAIYQWRATGENLKQLVEGDPRSTIDVTLTIRLRG